MADKKQFDDTAPAGGSDPSDLDPFAELTRIMGFDPRQPIEPKAKPAAVTVTEENFVEALKNLDTGSAAPVSVDAASHMAKQFQAEYVPAGDAADDFGIDLERELLGDLLADAEPAGAEAPLQAIAPETITPEPIAADPVALTADEEFDAVFADEEDELGAVFHGERREEEPDADVADVEELNAAFVEAEIETAAPVAADIGTAVAAELDAASAAEADEIDLALDDLDFGDIEAAIGHEMDQALAKTALEEPVALQTSRDGFDAALEAAFADGDFDDLQAAARAPASNTGTVAASDGLAAIDMDFDSVLDWSELDEAKGLQVRETAVASAAKSAFDSEADDLLAALDAAAAKSTEVSPGLADVELAASNPESVSALAKMADRYQQDTHDTWRQPVRTPHAHAAAPEVETTEMFEQALPMADDLDLPEVAYDEPAAVASDLDLEFDNLLNEMSRGDTHRPRPAAASAFEAPRFEPIAPIAPRAQANADDFGFDSVFAQSDLDREPQPEPQLQDLGSFDFDDDDLQDDEPLAQPPYRGNARGNGGRSMMIALIVGGIAVLGGLGAVAMSWGDGPSGAPAMVRADAGPIKVRPENPGGTSVPNRDSTVYEAVSRSGDPQEPAQERLVSATEDPIALPQPNDEETDELAAMVKGEDRVEPGQVDEAAQEPVAVAPRKVRTVIVKPDGSLAPAPAEPVAEAADATVDSTDEVASIAEQEPEQITTGATKPTPVKPEPVAAAPVAAGGWAIQIASQPSEDAANKSLRNMTKRYAGVIGDRGSNIVKAEVAGKGTFWRVRIAAASRDDAVSLCSNLKSAGGSCFVTR